jgi:hypothetical protein
MKNPHSPLKHCISTNETIQTRTRDKHDRYSWGGGINGAGGSGSELKDLKLNEY